MISEKDKIFIEKNKRQLSKMLHTSIFCLMVGIASSLAVFIALNNAQKSFEKAQEKLVRNIKLIERSQLEELVIIDSQTIKDVFVRYKLWASFLILFIGLVIFSWVKSIYYINKRYLSIMSNIEKEKII